MTLALFMVWTFAQAGVKLDCAVDGVPNPAFVEACLGERDLKAADAEQKQDRDRPVRLQSAADHFQKATGASDSTVKSAALKGLAVVYDAQHLNDPGRLESTLREMISFRPDDSAPWFRLSRLEEDQDLLEAAEDTLLQARRQFPTEVEAYKHLAQYYARRVGAFAQPLAPPPLSTAKSKPEPDEHGIYPIGENLKGPRRMGNAVYSPEALAAGIDGVVGLEITISETGTVADAQVLKSVPLLDEQALEAVREWRFDPTIVNGRPVPVKMKVQVNFTLSK